MKKLLNMIIVAAMIVISIFIAYSNSISLKKSPAAQEGVMDLSNYDLSKSGAISLGGEWEIYDGQLLNPKDFSTKTINKPMLSGYMNITSNALDYKKYKLMSSKGIRTYRLIIKLKPSDNTYGLMIDNIKMSSRTYVNGIMRGESGNAAEKDKGYYGQMRPYSTYFNIEGSKAEIILQSANYEYPFKGSMYTINFGLQKDISSSATINSSIELGGAIITLLIAIYSLKIYSTLREDKIYLNFGVCFILLTMDQLLNGEKMIYMLVPDISFIIFSKAQFISVIFTLVSILVLANKINKNILPSSFNKIAFTIATALIFIVLLTEYSEYAYLKPIIAIFIITFLTILIISSVMVIKKNKEEKTESRENAIFLQAMICIYIYCLDNYLFYFYLVYTKIFGFIGFWGFVVFSVSILSNRFSYAYSSMNKMSKELIEMDRIKDDFITKTSYELKAPLYGIINIAETIIKENSCNLNDKAIRDVMITKNIALRLTNIIKDILDVTLLKNSQLKLKIAALDINVCVNMVVESSKYIIHNKDIQVINLIKESIIVKADESRVRQILFNLINNSIKNMESGIVKIEAYKKDGMIYISVEDTGVGIPKEQQKDIFKPYENLNSDGIGLGLYISKQLVELMGGEISLEWSEVNKGSRFVFSLPYSQQESETYSNSKGKSIDYFMQVYPIDYSAGEQVINTKNTILIVDDEVTNIQTALNILIKEKYNVITAFSGEEAVKKLSEVNVDLILLDSMLPGTSGIHVCRKIREKYSLVELPILISTMNNINYDLYLGFEAGANDFIAKPFEEKELISRVRTLIALKKAMEEILKNELAFLQAQIKPHFLYNALSTIISFCYTDGEKAAKLLTNFSIYLRHAFDVDNKSMLVTIKEELEMVQAYAEIEKARFGHIIKVEYDIEGKVMQCKIPSLLIQPLVENSIKHGLCEKEEGGTVYISIKREEEYIVIVIRDTGVGMSNEKIKDIEKIDNSALGVGLTNTIRRVRKLSKAHMDIKSKVGEGTTITIKILIK
ncbi:response regulator [Clostridium sp. 19966]|uniref:hybrid sensor histidine kinase/response regulator n=1 Tax=Clostridium sp. 19966 TaxID=2768166 RepID=UPI0028DFE037|nr:ATP-binding protein [Clostridium sp. 19966]MDT8715085.1 response regulator [Clostridium sp. 19966]